MIRAVYDRVSLAWYRFRIRRVLRRRGDADEWPLWIGMVSLAAAVTLILAGQEELGSGVIAFALGLGMSMVPTGAQPADELDDDAATSPESPSAKRGER